MQDFLEVISNEGLRGKNENVIRIGIYDYSLSSVDSDYEKNFVSSKPMQFFVTYLGAGERLSLTGPIQRGNYLRDAPKEPLQWLEFNEDAEEKIREVFRKNFNSDLVLNTLGGDTLSLHVVPLGEAPTSDTARAYSLWLSGMPLLNRQGDGIRSFTGAVLSLLVHPRNIVLLDEPEAFIHPPQARKLAEFIAKESSTNSQIILAAHSDEVVKAMLDASGNRVIVARIMRQADRNYVSVLRPEELIELWTDPTLRTSDVLSALFHQVAIICEGDSEARFYKALLDATVGEARELDARFYYFGGKDRIPNVASALIGLNVPVVAIVDIDILSDRAKFFKLFETFGGFTKDVDADYSTIVRSVDSRKGHISGMELSNELRRIAEQVKGQAQISKAIREELNSLVKLGSNWERLKQGGYKMLVDASSVQAYNRIEAACKHIGITINNYGELERFCPEISQSKKGEWLAQVLLREIGSDPSLEEARKFAEVIRTTMAISLERAFLT